MVIDLVAAYLGIKYIYNEVVKCAGFRREDEVAVIGDNIRSSEPVMS